MFSSRLCTLCLVLCVVASASTAAATSEAGTVAWKVDLNAEDVGDASYGYSSIFLAADNEFYRLDAGTGDILWKKSYDEDSTPREKMPSLIQSDKYTGLVFVDTQNGAFEAVGIEAGETAWTFQTDSTGWVSNPQVYADGGLVLTNTETTLYGIDVTTQNVVWKQGFNDSGAGTGRTLYVQDSSVYTTNTVGIVSFGASTGDLLWSTPIADIQNAAAPNLCVSAKGNRILTVGVENSYSYSALGYDPVDGTLLWNFTTASNVSSKDNWAMHNYASDDGTGVLYFAGPVTQYALDCDTGAVVWEWPAPAGGGLSSGAYSNGVFYVGSDDYNIYAFNGATGKVNWKQNTGAPIWSDPIVGDRSYPQVFCGSESGLFFAFNTY